MQRKEMKTIIAGSRSIENYYYVARAIKESMFHITEVVCGTAPGVDTLGGEWGLANQIPVKNFPAAWRVNGLYNPRAGFERNQVMADYADALILVWDGESKGSVDMLARATKEKLVIYVDSPKRRTEGNLVRFFDWDD